ncbi:CDP-alcohol phosphatidyltransferase family protein [Candidatus Clostridium radicumherbarum]|uniref:CDP-alcohol phosphatidyltransferase family protein n=1 Tax=Candidatus Clostridium radicumherbarum TaxID=3381662 RepID=A0ABW8TMQ0_9CLOT
MLDTKGRKFVQPIIETIAELFLKLGFKANSITFIAFIIGVLSAVVFYFSYNLIAVILLWISGLLDAVDGTMARKTKATAFGTILDITFDRVVEISIIIAAALKFPNNNFLLVILLSSIILSMTVFLTVGALSDKNSEKSFYYQPGLAERTEGFIFFSLMILFNNYINIISIIFSLAIFYTAMQRIFEAKRILT